MAVVCQIGHPGWWQLSGESATQMTEVVCWIRAPRMPAVVFQNCNPGWPQLYAKTATPGWPQLSAKTATPDDRSCLSKPQPRMTAVVCQNCNPGWRQLFAKSPSWITAKCSQSCSRKHLGRLLFLSLYFLQDWNSQLPYRAVMGMLYEQKNKAVVFLICINIYFRNYKRWTFTMAQFMIGTYKTKCWITWIKFFVVG